MSYTDINDYKIRLNYKFVINMTFPSFHNRKFIGTIYSEEKTYIF